MLYKVFHKFQFLRHPFNMEIQRVKQALGKNLYEEHKEFSYNLETFNNRNSQLKWDLQSDLEIGGKSQVGIQYESEALSFIGELVPDLDQKLEVKPYVKFEYTMHVPLSVQHFNGIRLVALTDGKPLKITLFVSSDYDIMHAIYGYIFDERIQWQSYYLPFSNFMIQSTLKDEIGQNYMENEKVNKLYQIIIQRESNKDEKVNLKIKKLDIIYEPNFKRFTPIPRSPMFFTNQDQQK